ncbi:MAG: protoheme IX farnesyltransferase [Deltaproteobacteria bacterium]|nr:MAG: protoheme IX farnesyltransferase [Deltaproteobacteria bacterium]
MRVKNLALSTIVITFLLLILGGIVHNTQSSLACPDWPLCYGKVFPDMKDGVLIEHSHRLLASLVGFLTILLTFFTWKRNKTDSNWQEVFHLSTLSLVMVIAQGVLGGITVIYRLPTIVSTTHLGLSMIFFCTIILLHHKLALLESTEIKVDDLEKEKFSNSWKPIYRHGILISGVLIYLQMVLGAFMRHSGAGASCGLGSDAWNLCLDMGTWTKSWWPEASIAQLHMVHRYFAIFVTLVSFLYSAKVLTFFVKTKDAAKSFRTSSMIWAVIIPVAIFFQVALGVMTVAMNISVVPTTLHLGMAAVCLAGLWKLNLILFSAEEKYGNRTFHSIFSDFVELTKPKLSGLVMMTAVVGFLLAPGELNFFKGIFSLLMIYFVVMGACALNCYIERDVDALMERTRDRSLPAGRLNPMVALSFGIVLVGSAIALMVFYVNLITAILSALAAILYLWAYTPMKQKSPFAVVIGAIPGAIPPLLGWTTVTGTLDLNSFGLFLILFVWQLPHFMAISIFNAKDYDAANIKVYPNQISTSTTWKAILVLTAAMIATTLAPYSWSGVSKAYFIVALLLAVPMTLLALAGIKFQSNSLQVELWAKRYFWGTILYLPLLLGAMIFLK